MKVMFHRTFSEHKEMIQPVDAVDVSCLCGVTWHALRSLALTGLIPAEPQLTVYQHTYSIVDALN